jgi:hypothetical protein
LKHHDSKTREFAAYANINSVEFQRRLGHFRRVPYVNLAILLDNHVKRDSMHLEEMAHDDPGWSRETLRELQKELVRDHPEPVRRVLGTLFERRTTHLWGGYSSPRVPKWLGGAGLTPESGIEYPLNCRDRRRIDRKRFRFRDEMLRGHPLQIHGVPELFETSAVDLDDLIAQLGYHIVLHLLSLGYCRLADPTLRPLEDLLDLPSEQGGEVTWALGDLRLRLETWIRVSLEHNAPRLWSEEGWSAFYELSGYLLDFGSRLAEWHDTFRASCVEWIGNRPEGWDPLFSPPPRVLISIDQAHGSEAALRLRAADWSAYVLGWESRDPRKRVEIAGVINQFR